MIFRRIAWASQNKTPSTLGMLNTLQITQPMIWMHVEQGKQDAFREVSSTEYLVFLTK